MIESDPKKQRRSQRVALQVAVLIRATLLDGKAVRVQAFTSAVNAHGGLLESPVKLEANQRILLSNPHSGKDVGCRVVGVAGPSALYEVAFPPEDWSAK